MIKKFIGSLISKLYWKFGREYDGNDFWNRIAIYHFNGLEHMSGSLYITEINKMNAKLDLKAEMFWRGPMNYV